MTIDEAIKHAEKVADYDCYNEKQLKCAEEHRRLAEWLKDYKRLLEQESHPKKVMMRDATPEEREAISKYIKSISKPTGIEFDEEQEQLDFVQPHKSIPVKLKVIEPCEDAISRSEALSVFRPRGIAEDVWKECDFYKKLTTLPPVTPKPETGHWIYDNIANNWRCDKCGETPKTMGYVGTEDFMSEHFRFCNHCGARMIEPQERSEE